MNNKTTQYNYEPELQNALREFIITINDIYDAFDLHLSCDEKIKIQEIRNKRREKWIN